MKKYCAMILTLLLSIAAFVGCAAKAPASTPTAAPTAAQTSAPAPAPTQTLAGAQDQAAAPKYVHWRRHELSTVSGGCRLPRRSCGHG